MKKIFVLLVFSSLIAVKALAQAQPQELILAVNNLSDKNFDLVKTDLLSVNGLTLVDYCEQNHCFMLIMDTKIIPDPMALTKRVAELGFGLTADVKIGASIAKLKQMCK